MYEYILDSAMWSLGGLLFGYVLGRTERDVIWIRRKLEKRNDKS